MTRGRGKDKRERRNLERAVSIAVFHSLRATTTLRGYLGQPCDLTRGRVCVCVCMYGPTYNAANNAGTARATFAFSIDARSTCHVRTGPGVRSIVDRSILGDLDLLI